MEIVKSILFVLLIVAFYISVIVVAIVFSGTIMQLLKWDEKIKDGRMQNLLVFGVAALLFLIACFSFLNDWASLMWNEYVHF